MNLTICKDRQRILDATSHVLVTGGPGAGKTAIALAKAEKRIEEGLIPGQSILFLSFSRAAVARILESSKSQLRKEVRSQLSIQTFHSFFWQVLQAYGYLVGATKHPTILLPHDETVLRSGETEDTEEWKAQCLDLFAKGSVVFDMFAPKVLELLQKANRLRNLFSARYPMVIVDEAQDTSEDQWQTIKILSENTQLMCLADLDQQIYDFRPGVSAQRVVNIMAALNPVTVDLQSQNYRSPDSEIVTFGNDILLNRPRGKSYKGVTQRTFETNREKRDLSIRSSVGIVAKSIQRSTGKSAENIAILASWGRGVTAITKALTGNGINNRIAHRVVIDEAPVLLASRVIAFLMEPRLSESEELLDAAHGLELTADIFRAKGGKTNLQNAQRFAMQAIDLRKGNQPRRKTAADSFLRTVRRVRSHTFTGEPKRDWLDTRTYLRESGSTLLESVADYAEQLVAFQRGQNIAAGLAELWQNQGHYMKARAALDNALAQEQLLAGSNDLHGIHVMTIHKSKGKEFDGVIILDDGNNSPFLFCREPSPYVRSRKLLRVGITRAKHHVLLLTDRYNKTPLLAGHKL
jgi:DNA helicase-2/ATP-dependent DNA helicase PcrA